MKADFTLTVYRKLLTTLQQSGYHFFTFEDWCKGKANGRYVILRHDVDLKAGHSLATARIESEMGIRATYYFRIVPQSNKPSNIKAIAELGHEIGYHYEDLSLFDGDIDKALEHFGQWLEYFRQFYPVKTICMHGSPTSRWDNRDLWKSHSYKNFGIIGEPYFDFLNVNENVYLTDTARMWNGDKYNIRDKTTQQLNNSTSKQNIHSTFDFIHWIEKKLSGNVIMITTHPQRWTNRPVEWMQEYFMQNLKNIAKRWIIKQK